MASVGRDARRRLVYCRRSLNEEDVRYKNLCEECFCEKGFKRYEEALREEEEGSVRGILVRCEAYFIGRGMWVDGVQEPTKEAVLPFLAHVLLLMML